MTTDSGSYKILHLISSRSILAYVSETDDAYICVNPYQMFPGTNMGVFVFEQMIPFAAEDETITILKDKVV